MSDYYQNIQVDEVECELRSCQDYINQLLDELKNARRQGAVEELERIKSEIDKTPDEFYDGVVVIEKFIEKRLLELKELG